MAVWPAAAREAEDRLFGALQLAFAVDLVPWQPDGTAYVGLVALGAPSAAAIDATGLAAVPVLEFGRPSTGARRTEDARIGEMTTVDRRLRTVVVPTYADQAPLAPGSGEEVLAVTASGPAWTRRSGPRPVDRVRGPIPNLGPEEPLRDQFRDGRTLGLVAIVHFLRRLTARGWTPPPLRAAFVFDDPNLRRASYGFIDYAGLLEHAELHGYHAVMAMIPLDAGRVHPDALAAFRDRSDRLSLTIHGNNHTRDELLRLRRPEDALGLAAQALRRVARFESQTGVAVDRVMMPPHGMCSRTMTGSLGALGYDALCAQHPCPWTEHAPADRVLAGWMPCEFVDGCAVLPRLPFASSATEIALRAFLDQPLVLYGHHGDLAGGLEPLAKAAERVNRLGDARWCSVGEIVESNYHMRARGDAIEVQPWAARLAVRLPPASLTLTVHAPPPESAPEVCGWTPDAPGGARLAFGAPQPLDGQSSQAIRLVTTSPADPAAIADPPTPAWVALRRTITQARDRSAPLRARRLRPSRWPGQAERPSARRRNVP